jgi:hypothetical protein
LITENLSTLKIHKLSQEQYDRELEAGRIDKNALYLTPEDIDIPGGIDTETIKEAVNDFLAENPPAQGEPGKTPVKGEDYFTPEEVQEIAEQAAEMVEVPDTYTRQEIDAIMGSYITDIDTLVGGGS